jgi:hypothetical protein
VLRPRRIDVAPDRPGWLTAGAIRLGILSVFVVAVGMVRPRLTDHSAGILLLVSVALVVVAAALFLGSTRRLAQRLRLHGVAEPVLAQVRRTGLPLLGLAFFLFWAMVYVALWLRRRLTWPQPTAPSRTGGPPRKGLTVDAEGV